MNVLKTNFIKMNRRPRNKRLKHQRHYFNLFNSLNKLSFPINSEMTTTIPGEARSKFFIPNQSESSKEVNERSKSTIRSKHSCQQSLHFPDEEEKRVRENVSLNATSRITEWDPLRFSPDRHDASSSSKTPTIAHRKTPKMTSCSSKYRSSDYGGYILAVTEGRGQARGEVGIAGMDPRRPLLVLCQISDGQRYINSLTKMNVFDFSEVIVPNTFVDSEFPNKLYCDIRARFPNVTLTNVQRRHFNEALGIDLVRQYCCPESSSVMVLLRDKFYALSAAAALIKYLEFTQNIRPEPRSLKIEYQGTQDSVLIDLDTANRLELIACMRNPDANNADSLMGIVNYCRTKAGSRLLRVNILQPFFGLERITARLKCVDELVNDGILFCALEAAVTKFANVESLLNLCMQVPQRGGIRTAEYQLKYTLMLKSNLEQLPLLIGSLEKGKSPYFRRAAQSLKDARFASMLERISEIVFDNARVAKGSVAGHLHGCFAIKTGVNGLLDVAKKTYCEIVQDITDHVTQLRAKHDLPLRISFSATKGFHLRCPFSNGRKYFNRKNFPDEFILVEKSKTTFTFYTAHLVALDKRSQRILEEIKLMTNAILYDLLTDIRPRVGCLFSLCEIIAELDVIVSFAHVSSLKNYVKPNFGNVLNLKSSRHPILEAIRVGEIVSNDVRVDAEKNFIVLTGPNQSGKSMYIRQIALLQIMAQIGCFVPATRATFKLVDRLFSRIDFDDRMESNASTIMAEMKDVEYIRQNLTNDSIVIIDELCRGTSVEEGTQLAFAICEQMLDSSAFVFCTTHYLFLTRLEEMYSNVVNWHFDCELKISESGETAMSFTHRLKAGATNADAYGLLVAESTSFPRDVWTAACGIAVDLRRNRKPQKKIDGLLVRHRLASELKTRLAGCEGRIEWGEIEGMISDMRKDYDESCRSPSKLDPSHSPPRLQTKSKRKTARVRCVRVSKNSILSRKICKKYEKFRQKTKRRHSYGETK